MKLVNLKNPKIQFHLDGTLPLKSVYPLFNAPAVTNGRGEIELRNVQIEGYYKDMINPSRIHRVKSNGVVELDDAALTINDERLTLDRGLLTLRGNDLSIEEVKLEGAGSEMELNGSASNFLPVLLADSINSKNAHLTFNAKLKSAHLDIDRLIKVAELQPTEEQQSRDLATKGLEEYDAVLLPKKEFITKYLLGTFDAEVESFDYNLIEGESFTGKLEFANNQMTIIGEAGAMGGSFDIDGTGYFERNPRLRANIVCNDINAKEFFRQCENFGQEVLQSKHIEGNLNAKMVVSAKWEPDGTFMEDELRVIAGIGIANGTLSDFELLEEFSSYVKVRDLRNVRFVDMQNTLEIQNRRIYIPVMFIQSNAMNMLLSGEHTFDNNIDYNIKVNAGQVLLAKFKKHNPNLDPQPAKKHGLFNLYFNVKGHIDDYEVETNKRKVKREFTRSEYRKRAIEKALKEAFGTIELIEAPKELEDQIPEYEEADGEEEYLDVVQGSGKSGGL